MIHGRDIICFSSDWGGHIDSSHHIMRRLMEANRVLWVNSTGLRPPKLSLYDLKRIWSKMFPRGRAPADVPSGLTAVYTPRLIPFYGNETARAFNRWTMEGNVRRRTERLAPGASSDAPRSRSRADRAAHEPPTQEWPGPPRAEGSVTSRWGSSAAFVETHRKWGQVGTSFIGGLRQFPRGELHDE